MITGELIQELCDVSIYEINYLRKNPSVYKHLKDLILVGSPITDSLKNKIKETKSFFIKMNWIKYFVFDILPNIQNKFILITHDSDYNSGNIQEILNHPLLIGWYGENMIPHHKTRGIPIGLENKDMWNRTDFELIEKMKDTPKTNMMYFNFNDTHPSRTHIRKVLLNNGWSENKKESWDEYIKNLSSYKFCASPRGNGIDTHRIWECIYLGVIPIVQKDPQMYHWFNELPILWVNDFEEVTQDYLNNVKITNNNLEITTLNYWKDMIHSEWDTNDLLGYTFSNKGQISDDQYLHKIIHNYASDKKNKTFLEIGTWNGQGSTKAFVNGLSKRDDDYIFYSLECNSHKSRDAQKLYKNHKNVFILNEVIWNEMPDDFYEIFPECLDNELYKKWNEIDIINMKRCNVFVNRKDIPDVFDVILFDGGEFTTWYEFLILKDRVKYVILDDTNTSKCKRIVEKMYEEKDKWKIIEKANERNGFIVAERLS